MKGFRGRKKPPTAFTTNPVTGEEWHREKDLLDVSRHKPDSVGS